MSLQTAMHRRPRQILDRGQQGIKTVIQRQQCVPPESNDHGFLFLAENGSIGGLSYEFDAGAYLLFDYSVPLNE
jgi:hypothetical protein